MLVAFLFLMLPAFCTVGRAADLSAAVFVLDVCKFGAATPPASLRPVMQKVGSLMRNCSFNALGINSYVVPETVYVPCSGVTPQGVRFDSAGCPFSAWGDFAIDYAQRVLRVPVWRYTHRIFVVPAGDVCKWGGMGYVGCTGDCRVWVSGDLWDMPAVYFHELGHNMGLGHAGMLGDNGYGDYSGAMGFCCDVRCHSAPHANALGWAAPVAVLNRTVLLPGQWISFDLPAAFSVKKNHVLINPDWDPKIAQKLYVSYRKRGGADATLRSGFGDVVVLHSMPRGQNVSSFETSLGANQMVEEARLGTGVVLHVGAIKGGKARVSVCRRSGARQQCLL